jgi:hypothetical protein
MKYFCTQYDAKRQYYYRKVVYYDMVNVDLPQQFQVTDVAVHIRNG